MKYTFAYLFLFFLFYCQTTFGTNQLPLPADSVINRIYSEISLYGKMIDEYHANLYLKGHVNIKKKNLFLDYFPLMFKLKKGVYEYIIESYSELHYTAPNIFDNKIIAQSGTIDAVRNFNKDIINLLSINIYSESFYNDNLISPFVHKAYKYYEYKTDSISADGIYYLSFHPVNKSYQLVEGYVAVSGDEWKIREFRFKKRNEYVDYVIHIVLGDPNVAGHEKYLPKDVKLTTNFHFLGNVVEGNFNANFDYSLISVNEKEKKLKKKYDLSNSFTLQNDTSALISLNSQKFDSLRTSPLSKEERELYKRYEQAALDSTNVKKNSPNLIFWRNIEDVLFGTYVINSPQVGQVQFSPLLYPSLLQYNAKNGFSYKQKIRYNRLFYNQQMFSTFPQFGYNFKHKEFHFSIPVTWEYMPRRNAYLNLEVGNGNRIYTSDFAEKLGLESDTIDFDKLDIKYYRDLYGKFTHNIEIVNGLTMNAGVAMHYRSATKDKSASLQSDKIEDSYTSFAPRISLSWTPGQYYYISGRKKINVRSHFPTFSLDYERSLKVLGSSIKYEKIELDLQHRISLGVLQTLFYRVGAGVFTEQEDRYFIDFRYFTKSNLPTGWNDDMGGVFQLLDRRWYNSSRKYARANFTYEVPFLLAPYLLKWTPSIINERLYLGVLFMPHLTPYLEFGYGIGTNFFDASVFVSNVKGEFCDVGMKFTLQLFNH